MVNYYHVLGLTETATPQEIRAAFKRLAVKYHPDKHPGRADMEEKFKEINEAHQVLSDTYEKARFDLKLKYQQFVEAEPRPHPSARPYSAYAYHRRHQTRKMSHKDNMKATAYAFAFTFAIALLVMSGIWAKEAYDERRMAKFLEARREMYKEAKASFDQGDYHHSFEIMSELKYFRSEEKDMRMFKESMIGAMISIGDENYQKGDYPNAILHYELIQEFDPENPFIEQKRRLASAYRLTQQFDKSIELLENFMVNEYDVIGTIAEIAEINKVELKNLEKSKEYYDLGHRLAKKKYTRFYGEGYPLVIKGEYLPVSHYHLYVGLADNYFRMGDYRMAIKAADWNKYVWPDSASSYVTTGDAYLKMRQESQACEEYIQAMNRGWKGNRPISCF